jgi:hypothetical protein
MAILHTYEITDPNRVGLFPPSILASEWYKNAEPILIGYQENYFFYKVGNDPSRYGAYIFDDDEQYLAYKSAFELTDPVLISHFNEWCAAHDVKLETKQYTITEI